MREKLQKEALNKLLENKGGLLLAPMRFGKSKVVIDFAKEVGAKNIILITTGKSQVESFRNELKKWNFTGKFQSFTYTGISRLSSKRNAKIQLEFCNSLLILDEVHHITENNVYLIAAIKEKVTWIIAMTATMPSNWSKKALLKNVLGFNKPVYEVKLEESTEVGINRPFEIIQIQIPLSKNKNSKYSFKNAVYSEKEMYEKITKDIKNAKGEWKERLFINRMHFLGSTPSKVYLGKQLVQSFKNDNRRAVFFVNKREIGFKIYKNSFIHGKLSMYIRDNILRTFNNGDENILVALDVINEGVELVDVDVIVFVGFNRSYIKFFQRVGRALNQATNQGILNVIILIHENTVEETWIRELQKSLGIDIKVRYKYNKENNKLVTVK